VTENEYIANHIAEALRKRKGRAFTKADVVAEVETQIHHASLDMRGLVREKIATLLDRPLKAKDAGGVRIYCNYATGSERRWQDTESMTLWSLRSFILKQESRHEEFGASIQPMRALLTEMERVGAEVVGVVWKPEEQAA
jgi:hypothetical protein